MQYFKSNIYVYVCISDDLKHFSNRISIKYHTQKYICYVFKYVFKYKLKYVLHLEQYYTHINTTYVHTIHTANTYIHSDTHIYVKYAYIYIYTHIHAHMLRRQGWEFYFMHPCPKKAVAKQATVKCHRFQCSYKVWKRQKDCQTS